MALYQINNNKISQINILEFKNEKELQTLCENNLEELFQVRFIRTEFPFADEYSGRLDTIGIDKEGNPVIIEYKLGQNSSVISQCLFYMDWLVNHKGDFVQEAKNKLGNNINVVWDKPKMIIVANDYNKYDKYAVNQINYDIYLYKYTFYKNGAFLLENINTQENKKYSISNSITRNSSFVEYNEEYHTKDCSDDIKKIYDILDDEILKLSDIIEKRYTKIYIGYRTTKNFLEMQLKKSEIQLYLLPAQYDDEKGMIENVPESYKYSLNKRIHINSINEIDYIIKLIKKSLEETL